MSAPGSRLLIGNLDCESDFAARQPAAAGGRRVAAGRRALETAAAAATLLRVFARDGDRLWLPAKVPTEHVADVPGLPRPALECGPLDRLARAVEVLAWGETGAVARLRGDRRLQGPAEPPALIHELVWRLPRAAPEAAARVNDRRFGLRLAAELGRALPGARPIDSLEELERHLAAGGARFSGGAWVVKAPFSAAGRWRVVQRRTRPGGIAGAVRRRVERLIERHGALVFEPWMARTADFGCAAAVTPEGTRLLSLHRQLLDAEGRFTGVELVAGARGLSPASPCDPWLAPGERSDLERAVEGVARALAAAGYQGPFGVDAWRYRSPGGGEAFHPLGEVNARMTFGLVARAIAGRLRGPLGLDSQARVRLVFGRRGVPGCGAVRLFGGGASGREIRFEVGSSRV